MLALVEDRTRERRVETVRRDFVANVSHELKTPVGAIRLLAEAVGDASDDPEAVERFARRMLTESDRLLQMVQQIIELSRLQGDEPIEAPAVVDVDAMIARSLDVTVMDAGSKNIKVVAGGTPGLRIFGNEEQLSTAITNLLANAVTYSGADSTVLISTKQCDDMVDISVVDQGIGIPQDELDRIFDASTGSTRPGTGPPAAPDSASRSSSTSRPPTVATYECGRWRDRAPPSPCRSRAPPGGDA